MDRNATDLWLAALLVAAAGLFWPTAVSAEAGDGLRAGDLKLSPSLTLSAAYDQNVFRLDPSERDLIGSPIVAGEPALKITTIDPTAVDFSFDGAVEWEQYVSSERSARNQSGLNASGGLGLTLNPKGGVSFGLSDDLKFTNDPPPYPGGNPHNRLRNRAGARIGIHPGDRILEVGLGYKYSIYRYPTPALRDLAKDSHDFQLDFTWRFLPKTAVVVDGDASLVRYRVDERSVGGGGGALPNVDSTPIHVKGGLSGLLSRRLSARLLAGYATGLYESGPSYNGPIGRADLKYQYGTLDLDNHLSVGYRRSFSDSSIGNFYGFHRAGLDWRQNFADKRFGISAGVNYTRRDYATLTQQTETRDGVAVLRNRRGQLVAVPDLFDNFIEAKAGVHSKFLDWWKASVEYNYQQNLTGNEIEIPAADFRQLRAYNRHYVMLSTTIGY